MRLKKALLVFLISTANLAYSQIKIGDNPQNINQSSVLELESTSRALVITRVSTTQMNAITPLQGAMVYNIDTQCIHYYNGSQWLNLCDALANSVNISLVDNGDGTYTFSDANNNLTEINNLNESLVVEDGNLILTDTSGNAISVELQNLSAQTFTTDAIINTFPTIFITQDATGTNFNFEVGVIDGESIQDGSIKQIDLAGASVGSAQLRDNSVGNLAIADNAVGTLEIINGSVQPIDLGPGNTNQILTTNGAGAVQWVDQTGLISADEVTYNNAISNLTANNVQEALDEVTNNINTLTIGDILTQGNDAANQNIRNVTDPSLPQDAATKNYVDQAITAGTADGSETILNDGTNINITGTGTSGSPYIINNTFTEVDGSLTNEIQSLSQVLVVGNAANNSITNLTNPVAAQDAATKAYVDAQVGGSAQVIVSGNTPNSIIPGTDGGALYNDGDSDDTNELSDLVFNAGSSILTLSNPATPANSVDLSSLSGTGTDDQNLTGASLSGTILQIDIENGNSATVDLGTLSGVDTDDQTLSLSGNEISISEGNTIDLTPILGTGGTDDQQLVLAGNILTLEDGGTPIDLTRFLDDTDDQTITDFTFDNATNILTLTIDGGNTDTADLSALAGGGNPTASDVTFTPIGNTASNDVQLAIEELQTEIDGISGGGAANPNDELITSFTLTGTNLNIAEGANVLPPVDLDPIFTTDAELASFTPDWTSLANIPADIADGDDDTTYSAGIGLTFNGTDFDVDNLAGDVTGPTSATVIADNAVTSTKIANGAIAAVDLNQMGATTNQVMKWNGTAWAPATDNTGSAVTDTDANDGLTDFNPATGYNINVDNTTVELNADALRIKDDAVTSAKIANGAIAAVDLNQMGATTNQVMKWNGTAWAPATDNTGSAVTDTDANDGLTDFNPATGYNINVDNTTVELNADALRIKDDAVTSAKIANGAIAAVDLNQMGATTNQVMKWNGTAWAPATDNTGSAVTDTDANDGLTDFNPATGYNINVDNTTVELNADALRIKDDAVTSAKIANGAIAAVDLNQMGATTNQVMKWNGTAWAPATDNTGSAVTDTDANDGLTDFNPATGYNINVDNTTVELNADALRIKDDAVTSAKIANGAIAAVDLNQMGATTNQVMKWNGTAWAPATDNTGSAVTDTDANDGLTDFNPATGYNINVDNTTVELNADALRIKDDAVTSAKIANGAIAAVDLNQMGATTNQVMKWNGTAWAPAADTGGTTYTAGIGLTLNGTDFDVDNLAGDVTGPTSATLIADNAVTSTKIANGAIAAVDLNQMGATSNQVMKWNGTAWAPAADAGGTTYTAGVGLTLNGSDFDVDNLAGDVTGPTSATVIADNAVTSAKIANGAIAAVDLNQMGATTNQVMKWNGTAWAPATDNTGSAVTDTDANDGLTDFNPATGYNINVDNTTVELNADALRIKDDAVTSAKIANGAIAAVDLNQMGATTNQVMKWNGTAWAPATDNTGSAVTDTDANDGLTDFNPATGYNINVDNTTVELNADALRIKDGGVTSSKIANGAISGGAGGQIVDGSITASDLDADSVDASEIRVDAVGLSEIEDNAVATGEIVNLTIINEDISNTAAIDGSKIVPNFTQGIVTTGGLSVQADILMNGNNVIPDYVFEKYFLGNSILNENYNFKTLAQIEEFIKKYHHLPGIKSASEVQKDGFWNLSESNLQNLEKIEELFLHTIEQEKKIQELKSENIILSKELYSLKNDLEEIKVLLKKD